MQREADRTFPLETGGVLIGYWADSQTDVVVVDVVGPGPAAQHTPATFLPDAAHHEKVVAQAYKRSDRRHVYLGDWHSHPLPGHDALSRRDRQTLHHIGRAAAARMPTPIMALLVRSEAAWDLRTWALRATRFSLQLRSPIESLAIRRF